jgi:hypothetical protein
VLGILKESFCFTFFLLKIFSIHNELFHYEEVAISSNSLLYSAANIGNDFELINLVFFFERCLVAGYELLLIILLVEIVSFFESNDTLDYCQI